MVKYIGYAVSIVMLLVFITVVFINPFLWEMFHIIRCNSAFCIFAACLCMFVAENSTIRKDRHDNITVSVFQQYWFLASSLSLLSESFATFRAITGLFFYLHVSEIKVTRIITNYYICRWHNWWQNLGIHTNDLWYSTN